MHSSPVKRLIEWAKQHFPRDPWYRALLALFLAGGSGLVLLALVSLALLPTLPSIENMTEGRLKVPMRVYTADGILIGEFGEERRIPIKIGETPELLIRAILAAEDAGFYDHHGVSFLGIARAAWANFRAGAHRQGASTITMQVARNFFLSPEKTYTRKLKEMLLSFKLERQLSKQEILELYLNKIFLGHRAYGFAAASRIYYGKKLSELSLPELAMLAGLPKAPSKNNPIRNKERALNRRDYILSRMFKLEYIDEAVFRSATLGPLSARKHQLKYDVEAPYISEMVRRYMLDSYDIKAYAGGFHVYTTINSKYQTAANRALRAGIMAYDRRHGYRGPEGRLDITSNVDKSILDDALDRYRTVGQLVPAVVLLVDKQSITTYTKDGTVVEIGWEGLSWARRYINENALGPSVKSAASIVKLGSVIYVENSPEGIWRLAQKPEVAGAFVAIRPNDGAILALTGGFDFYSSKFNRVTQAERQLGSNIKPFVYSAALHKGFTAATTVSGAPIAIEDETLEDVWIPKNYSGKFYGPTRLRKALTLSINLVSVRLVRAMGATYTVKYLSRFGFNKEKLPRNMSLALGSASVKPLEVVRAFSVFANEGFQVEPYFITRVEDNENNILEQANPLVVCLTCPEAQLLENGDAGRVTNSKAGDELPKEPKEKKTRQGGPVEEEIPEPKKDVMLKPRFARRTVSPDNIFIMRSIMQDVIRRGTGHRAMVLNRRDLAGKTGTSNDFRDAWFSGFTDGIAATSWIGFDQPASMGNGEAGSRAALPIWIDFMRVALEDFPEVTKKVPEGVVEKYVHQKTGKFTSEDNPDAIMEYFIASQLEESAAIELPEEVMPTIEQIEEGEEGENKKPKKEVAPEKVPENLF